MAYRIFSQFAFLASEPDGIDLTGGKVQAALIMAGNSLISQDPTTIAGFTTLNECDSTGYARKTVYFKTERDSTNVRAVLKSVAVDLTTAVSQLVWSALDEDASGNIVGVLFCTASDHPDHPNVPIGYITFAGGPVTANGDDFKVNLAATGVFALTNGGS